ncbi:MAG: hypothetical protein OWQ59_04665 [Alicyclobacillaceae bacterium]|nr:hypothetical protein [Alicyclobacillaceae bacterium]
MSFQRVFDSACAYVVERTEELRDFEAWLANESPSPTLVWSVQGIGGIGKTSFLHQIEKKARDYGVSVACLDGYTGLSGANELMNYLCELLGVKFPSLFLSVQEKIQTFVEALKGQKTILLFDHFDEMLFLESFLRRELIANLPSEDVLMVLASRTELSIGWKIDRGLLHRTRKLILGNFSWRQAVTFIQAAGIENRLVQDRLSRETSGYPLALALAVQSALYYPLRESEADSIPLQVSADLLRGIAPHLNRWVECLAFLRTATQDVLEEVLGESVSAKNFRELSRLSFIRLTDKGLVLHDVARTYLLSDLKLRNPQQFAAMFERTVHILGAKLENSTDSVAYDLSHNLVTLCTFVAPVLEFPETAFPMKLSARSLPRCEPVRESDVLSLHHLLDSGISAGIVDSRLTDVHALLDDILYIFPESLRVIHRSDGCPIAFATLLPMDAMSLAHLPTLITEELQDRLADEWEVYQQTPHGESDTTLSILSCVAPEAETEEYTFFDLLLALKVTGWSELAQGQRCLLLNTSPQVDVFYSQLGYHRLPSRAGNSSLVRVYALDFRKESMAKWLIPLLLNSSADKVPSRKPALVLSKEAVRECLKNIHSIQKLDESEIAKKLRRSGRQLQTELREALLESPPRPPLTEEFQWVLEKTYLHGKPNVVAITNSLNVGRATYYRRLDHALSALVQVLKC